MSGIQRLARIARGPGLLLLLISYVATVSCREAAPGGQAPREEGDRSLSATDDNGRKVRLARPATRVVTLVPSATETLVALGALPQIVGRTRHDTAPAVQDIRSVGGMLDPNLETLLSLRPDLVVAMADDKAAHLLRRLQESGIPIFSVQAKDTTDVFRNIERLGLLTGRTRSADSLAAALRSELAQVRASVASRPTPSVLYVVWHDPPTIAGPSTFISQIIGVAGGRTVFPDLERDWPQVSLEEIVRRQPEVVVVPVGDDPAHTVGRLLDAPGWRELRAVREGRVVELPTDLMNRPGPHIAEAARRLRDALHPGAVQ